MDISKAQKNDMSKSDKFVQPMFLGGLNLGKSANICQYVAIKISSDFLAMV